MKRFRFTPLQLAVHAAALLPLAWLIKDYLTDNLTVNPIQAATQRTGDYAIVLLLLSLAVTPIITLTGYSALSKVRRPLGLYAFLYAAIHLFIFVGVDYGFNFDFLLADIAQKRFIFVGLAAFILLIPLAFTSYRYWQKRLGKNWKRLHRSGLCGCAAGCHPRRLGCERRPVHTAGRYLEAAASRNRAGFAALQPHPRCAAENLRSANIPRAEGTTYARKTGQ
jgi:DMSO/TMAO reductase YedYZ heme-binding membrane subunit